MPSPRETHTEPTVPADQAGQEDRPPPGNGGRVEDLKGHSAVGLGPCLVGWPKDGMGKSKRAFCAC